MAYGSRMSQQFHGSQQHHNRGRKKEDENDALMRLVSSQLNKASSLTISNAAISRTRKSQDALMT